MKNYTLKYIFLIGVFLVVSDNAFSRQCLENICIGDDLELLPVKWKDVNLGYNDHRFVEIALNDKKIEEVYYDYNERLIADAAVLKNILPYVIKNQQFDAKVLAELTKVKAICSSLTLTGEVERESETRLFVTFRAIADQGGRGKLRVVRLEKQFNVMAPHLRPKDAELFQNIRDELKKLYPELAVVRDIDGRVSNSTFQNSTAMLGFRFISDVSNPLILRLFDDEEVTMIEEDDAMHPECLQNQ